MQTLYETYLRIERILGAEIEPFESVQLVENYRHFMKPEKIKVVLLAESHVFTHNADREISLPPILDLPSYPTEYARFVYCLGYGEKKLTKNSRHPRRDGTPQFWKIFYSCNNPITSIKDFEPILGATPFEQRLKNKIELLRNLKEKGIWLVDASIVALYKDSKKIPNMFNALQESWTSYTKGVVETAAPESIICIGKGVDGVVGKDLRSQFGDRYTVIPQPNAFLTSEKHMENYQTYSRLCG